MSIVTESSGSIFVKNIKCPLHYVLKPGGVPFVMERDPRFLSVKEADAKIFKINIWRKKRDKWGQPILNQKDFMFIPIGKSAAREHIYRKTNPVCNKCRQCVTG